MTNEKIILSHALELMNNGIIASSGEFIELERADGTVETVELPEAIHTFQRWKELGRSIKKGEKAVTSFPIWKYTVKKLDTDTGNESLDAMNAMVNAQGGEKNMFMKTASFFSFGQTEPTTDFEARRAAKARTAIA